MLSCSRTERLAILYRLDLDVRCVSGDAGADATADGEERLLSALADEAREASFVEVELSMRVAADFVCCDCAVLVCPDELTLEAPV